MNYRLFLTKLGSEDYPRFTVQEWSTNHECNCEHCDFPEQAAWVPADPDFDNVFDLDEAIAELWMYLAMDVPERWVAPDGYYNVHPAIEGAV